MDQKIDEVAPEVELGMGAYLTYSEASQGTLFLNWSHEPVEGALAYFRPGRSVPKFKFKQKGGRSEIIRDCAMMKIKRHYTGWCHFIKLAKEFEGEFCLLSRDVRVFVNHDGPVVEFVYGEFFPTQPIQAVSVVNKSNTSFEVAILLRSLFVETGHASGASLDLS